MIDTPDLPISATFLGFIALLAVAAFYDAWKFQIPNVLSAALVALFLVSAVLAPPSGPWWSYLGGGVTVFVCGLGIYAFNWLGAGDVKLLSAAALFAGFDHLPAMLAYVLLSGGALTLGLMILRRVTESLILLRSSEATIALPKLLVTGEDIPYGVAIAIGAALYAPKLSLLQPI